FQRHQAEICIAAIVWHELWFGCYRLPASVKRAAIEKYLNDVVAATIPILPYDHHAAAWHAAERARLVGVGQTPPFAGGQIIAIAKRNNLTLVTANLADYAAFQGVDVVNWQAGS
ncbi:MAG TPA: hypothetical protein VFX76_14850, partial [Roseiflexaceae bacterium]|nr:hypothetical protein [Roseiflexaceae bacterium]